MPAKAVAMCDSLADATLAQLDLGILAGNTRNRVGAKVAEVMKRAMAGNNTLT